CALTSRSRRSARGGRETACAIDGHVTHPATKDRNERRSIPIAPRRYPSRRRTRLSKLAPAGTSSLFGGLTRPMARLSHGSSIPSPRYTPSPGPIAETPAPPATLSLLLRHCRVRTLKGKCRLFDALALHPSVWAPLAARNENHCPMPQV